MENLGNIQLEILKGENKNEHFKIISMKDLFFYYIKQNVIKVQLRKMYI